MAEKWTARDSMPDQTGRVVVITGANSGLGYESALAFAMKNATTVMACRSLEKGEEARKFILDQVPDAQLELMHLDLASLDVVRSFVDAFRGKYKQLHILMNNAGVMAIPRKETADGFEMQLGVNHLGHFALTGLLLDMLLATPGCRVVAVSSFAQYMAWMNFDDLNHEKSYSRWLVYNRSKLANMLFAFELQRRLEAAGANTISVVAHPGLSTTNLQKNSIEAQGGSFEDVLYSILLPLLAQGQEMGVLPQLYAATDPSAEGGAFFGPETTLRGYPERKKGAKRAHIQADAERLWQLSEELTGVVYPFEAVTV